MKLVTTETDPVDDAARSSGVGLAADSPMLRQPRPKMTFKQLNPPVAVLVLVLVLRALCFAADPAGPVPPDVIRVENYPDKIKLACVGDSITFGSGLKDRENNHYPKQLGRMLGEKWDVRNFGVGGTTMNQRGDRPYWRTKEYQQALEFKPDAVILMLGTNDVRQHNMGVIGTYKDDAKALINEFRKASPKVVVYFGFPPKSFNQSFAQDRRLKVLCQWIVEVAKETGCNTVSMRAALLEKGNLMPDGIHPNDEGAAVMAQAALRALTGRDHQEPAPPAAVPAGK